MKEYKVKVYKDRVEWWFEGKLHREDGPAIELLNGSKLWYKEGKRHRKDGPACEWSNGNKYWYKEGKRHQDDGPAIEDSNGDKYWYIEGYKYTEKQFNAQKCCPLNVMIGGIEYRLEKV